MNGYVECFEDYWKTLSITEQNEFIEKFMEIKDIKRCACCGVYIPKDEKFIINPNNIHEKIHIFCYYKVVKNDLHFCNSEIESCNLNIKEYEKRIENQKAKIDILNIKLNKLAKDYPKEILIGEL